MGNEDSGEGDLLEIEVAYAKPEEQTIVKLNVPQGTSIQQTIELSGLLTRFPEISVAEIKAGIFGVVHPLDQMVKQGDRVEIYRPLVNDPKEARRQRATRRA